MDSRYSFYIFPKKQCFHELREFDRGRVLLGDDIEYSVKGIGKIKLKLYDGSEEF